MLIIVESENMATDVGVENLFGRKLDNMELSADDLLVGQGTMLGA